MEIEITQRHINQGRPQSGQDCAIARAMKEQLSLHLGRVPYVYVDSRHIVIDGVPMPATQEISEFLKKFDTDKSLVSPITITISPYFPQMNPREYEYSKYGNQMSSSGMPPQMMEHTAPYNYNYTKMVMPKFVTGNSGNWGV